MKCGRDSVMLCAPNNALIGMLPLGLPPKGSNQPAAQFDRSGPRLGVLETTPPYYQNPKTNDKEMSL